MMDPMTSSQPPKRDWAYYRSLPGDERWELIDGELYAMAAPLMLHQRLSGELFAHLWMHFRGKSCEVWPAPIDVKLSEYDTVQPDLAIVCDAAQITETHIEGPPPLAIEVLSPSSVRHDRIRKFHLYARFGVREYWVVHPTPAMAEVFLLEGPHYVARGTYSDTDILESPSFPGLRLDLSTIFPEATSGELREGTPAYST